MAPAGRLRGYLGDRPELPTYLGGLVATLSWMWLVAQTIGDTQFMSVLAGTTAAGFAVSFWLRGLVAGPHGPALERGLLRVSIWLRLGFMLVGIGPALAGIGPLTQAVPDLARGQSEWLIGTAFSWAMTLYSFGMVSDGLVAFSSVLGVSMLGLMGTDNINPEAGIVFLVFLLGNVLMLSNMALGHYLGRARRGPTGLQLAHWLGDQVIVAGLTTAGTGFVAICLGGLLALVSPRLYVPPMHLSPFGGTTASGGFASFADQLVLGEGRSSLDSAKVFEVQCEQPLLWRRRVYDVFTGREWHASRAERQDVTVSRDGRVHLEANQATARSLEGVRAVHQRIVYHGDCELAAAAMITDLTWERGRPAPVVQVDSFDDVQVTVQRGAVINVLSAVTAASPEQLRRTPYVNHDDFAELLQVPTSARATIGPAVDRLGLTGRCAYDAAAAIQDFLETRFRYVTALRVPYNVPPLQHYFAERRGPCDLIASAMALMARQAGIPARIASGYATGERQPNGDYLVRLKDAHAWAELYFPGCGWVAFNPAVPGDEQESTTGPAAERRQGLARLKLTTLVLAVLVLGLVGYTARELWRARPRWHRGPQGIVAQACHRAQLALAAQRRGRRRHETLREHLARLRRDRPDAAWLAPYELIVAAYEQIRYGVRPLAGGEEAAVVAALAEFRRALRAERRRR